MAQEQNNASAATGKIIEYDLCSAPTVNSLRRMVNKVMRLGWQPFGSVVYGPDPERGPWHQVMVWLDSEGLIEAAGPQNDSPEIDAAIAQLKAVMGTWDDMFPNVKAGKQRKGTKRGGKK